MALHKGGDECDRPAGNCSLFRVPRTFQHEELWRVPGRDEAHGAGLPDHEDPQGRVKRNNESVEFSTFGFIPSLLFFPFDTTHMTFSELNSSWLSPSCLR